MGRAPLPNSIIASYIGDGAGTLIRRALGNPAPSPQSDPVVEQALDSFLEFYRIHKLDHTFLYPGVLQALETLRRGKPDLLMAVLSNKPVNASREICTYFDLDRFFFKVYGGNSFPTKKPQPLGLATLICEAAQLRGKAVKPDHTVLTGDGHVDVLTARNAGTRVVGCSYGFAPYTLALTPPDALAHSPFEWPVAIERAFPAETS